MGLLPWEEMFYSIKEDREDLSRLYATYITQRERMSIDGQRFNVRLSGLRHLMANNYTLLIVQSNATMADLPWHDWMAASEKLPQPEPYDLDVANVLSSVTEAAGGALLSVALYRMKPYAVDALTSFGKSISEAVGRTVGEGAADAAANVAGARAIGGLTEIGLNPMAEAPAAALDDLPANAAPEAVADGLAEAPACALSTKLLAGGIFLTLGIDAIIGAVAGSKEQEHIDDEVAKIQPRLDVANGFLKQIADKTVELEAHLLEQMHLFKANMSQLAAISPPTFEHDFEVGLEQAADFIEASKQAAKEYGFLAAIRTNYEALSKQAAAMGMPFDWQQFRDFMLLRKPAGMPPATVDLYIDYARAHSDSMAAAHSASMQGSA